MTRPALAEELPDTGAPSLACRLDAVLPHLAPGLADEAARARLVSAARHCPTVSGFGIECRLGDPGRVDLMVRFTEAEQERALAAGIATSPWPPASTLYVELDLPETGPPAPGYFVGPGDSGGGRPAAGTSLQDILALADWLGDERLGDGTRRFLAGRVAALPPNLWVGYLGRFPHRDPTVLRMTVSGVEVAVLPDFLRAFGTASLAVPMELVAALDGMPVRLVVALDLQEAFGAALGIELSPRRAGDWPAFLHRLRPYGFDDPRTAALCAWRGVTHSRGETLARRLNHVKLACRGGRALSAKAYVYVADIGPSATSPPSRRGPGAFVNERLT